MPQAQDNSCPPAKRFGAVYCLYDDHEYLDVSPASVINPVDSDEVYDEQQFELIELFIRYEEVWKKWTPQMKNLHPVIPEQYQQAVPADLSELPAHLQRFILEEQERRS